MRKTLKINMRKTFIQYVNIHSFISPKVVYNHTLYKVDLSLVESFKKHNVQFNPVNYELKTIGVENIDINLNNIRVSNEIFNWPSVSNDLSSCIKGVEVNSDSISLMTKVVMSHWDNIENIKVFDQCDKEVIIQDIKNLYETKFSTLSDSKLGTEELLDKLSNSFTTADIPYLVDIHSCSSISPGVTAATSALALLKILGSGYFLSCSLMLLNNFDYFIKGSIIKNQYKSDYLKFKQFTFIGISSISTAITGTILFYNTWIFKYIGNLIKDVVTNNSYNYKTSVKTQLAITGITLAKNVIENSKEYISTPERDPDHFKRRTAVEKIAYNTFDLMYSFISGAQKATYGHIGSTTEMITKQKAKKK